MMMHKLRTDNEQNIGIYSIDIDISNCCGIVLQQTFLSPVQLLAPTGALVLMMVYYLYIRPLFQIFTQSLDAIDITSVA